MAPDNDSDQKFIQTVDPVKTQRPIQADSEFFPSVTLTE